MRRVRIVVAVILGMGLLVALLFPFGKAPIEAHLVWVRLDGRLVSKRTSSPLPGRCLAKGGQSIEDAAVSVRWCSEAQSASDTGRASDPSGERGPPPYVAISDAGGRFHMYVSATWGTPIRENLLGMRFRPTYPPRLNDDFPFYVLLQDSKTVDIPIPDFLLLWGDRTREGAWHEGTPGADAGPSVRMDATVYGVWDVGDLAVDLDE